MKKNRITATAFALILSTAMAFTGCSSGEQEESKDLTAVITETENSGSSYFEDEKESEEGNGSAASAESIISGATGDTEDISGTTTEAVTSKESYEATTVDFKKKDVNSDYDETSSTIITLNGNTVSVSGEGASVEDCKVTITAEGDYVISGTLENGQIVVDADDKADVRIILNGVDITCLDSACIYVKNCDKCVITLADGTVNTLTDGDSYIYDDTEKEEPNAVIFSKEDLSFNGSGTLKITANFAHAIRCKDDLKISEGTYILNAKGNGIKAKDSLAIRGGDITVISESDCIKVTGDDDDETKGYLVIEGGTFDLTSDTDAVQAKGNIEISGGTFSLVTGGGSANSSKSSSGWGFWGSSSSSTEETVSAKGIKSSASIYITGGELTIDSSDDAFHAAKQIMVNDGIVSIASGDDGIHADEELVINGGTVKITKSYEGLEALAITINGGDISVTASDDGLNAAGGDGSSTDTAGRFGGMNPFATTEGACITINGGSLYVNATGDGIDSNKDLFVNGGVIMVDGPTDNGNGALDHNGTAEITGGTIVASGSSGMIENFESSSTQNVILIYFSQTISAGSVISVKDSSGTEVLGFTVAKQSQCAITSCASYKTGETYTVYVNGTEDASISCNAVISSNGSTGGGFGGGMGGFPGNSNGDSDGDSEKPFEGGRGNFPGNSDGSMTPPEGFDGMTPPEGFDENMTPPDGSESGNGSWGGFPGGFPGGDRKEFPGNNNDNSDGQGV